MTIPGMATGLKVGRYQLAEAWKVWDYINLATTSSSLDLHQNIAVLFLLGL